MDDAGESRERRGEPLSTASASPGASASTRASVRGATRRDASTSIATTRRRDVSTLRARRTAPTGLGLRAQIVLALLAPLILSVVLLGVAADRLATRSLELERRRTATLAARSIAALVQHPEAPPMVVDRAETVLGHEGVEGFELLRGHDVLERRGVVGEGLVAEVPLPRGTVRVWVAHPGEEEARRLVTLLVLYTALGAGVILWIAYVLLTRLIVRPIEGLEQAAERLARPRAARLGGGGVWERADDVLASVEGAREVASLAVTFNAMAADLRDERGQLEARLAELEDALARLEQAKTSLESAQSSLVRSEKLASVGRLAAGVAHEIGNPLAAILGLVELLRDGGLEPSEHAEFLARVQSETERIHRIIRGLLDFARKPDAVTRAGSLEDAVRDAVRLVAPQKDLHHVRIEERLEANLPLVRLDVDGATQLVLNLLLNAADAIESARGARGTASPTEGDAVRIEAFVAPAGSSTSAGREVVLRVTDSGTGIPEAALASIFEPFFTTKPPGRGTGLGLAVCQTLVEQAGGTLRASNVEGGGACFEVRLPASESPTRGIQSEASTSE